MNQQKPSPLSTEQMEKLFQGEKTIDDIVGETRSALRKKVSDILGNRPESESKKDHKGAASVTCD